MRNKRILLLHISNVSGHHSASIAIENAIKIISPKTQILTLNAFNYLHPHGEGIINSFYMFVIKRMPFLWGHLYDNSYWIKKTVWIKNAIHWFNFRKLEALLNDFQPDAVASTQAFPCGMVADFKQIKGINLPLVAVLTDFTLHSYWLYRNVDYYITPSEEIKLKLIEKGIESNRIKALGIPFNPNFSQNLTKFEARKKLNLNGSLFTILIMGGGQGIGPIKAVVKILNSLKLNLQGIIVCGTNKRLYSWIKKRLKSYNKNIRLFGYIKNVPELMSAADIIITKPGGITCAEALSKKLPMIIISPIPGQEANNAYYLTNQNAAIKTDKPGCLTGIITDLYNRPEKLKELSEAAARISKPNAARDIARLLLEL
ncbi:MAG: glycosyltransferase [Candidatus Omnitrophota bacterium]